MRTFKFRLIALATALFLMPAIYAQPAEALTQGRAAVLLAQRLGLALQTTRTLTEVEAARLLTENNIVPFDGWQLDQPLFENDLARLLVQAMGKEAEIPEEERNNPQTTAYQDLLLLEFDLEVTGTEIPPEALQASRGGQIIQPRAGQAVSTDPLIFDGAGQGSDQLAPSVFLPVSESDLQSVLAQVTPSPGAGAAGRPSQDVQDTTPSRP